MDLVVGHGVGDGRVGPGGETTNGEPIVRDPDGQTRTTRPEGRGRIARPTPCARLPGGSLRRSPEATSRL